MAVSKREHIRYYLQLNIESTTKTWCSVNHVCQWQWIIGRLHRREQTKLVSVRMQPSNGLSIQSFHVFTVVASSSFRKAFPSNRDDIVRREKTNYEHMLIDGAATSGNVFCYCTMLLNIVFIDCH